MLSVAGGSVRLERGELDRLVRSLRQLAAPAARSVAEEVSACMLLGQIDLCPTESELDALIEALERLHTGPRDRQGLPAVLALARGNAAPVRPLDPREVEFITGVLFNPRGLDRAWEYWARRAGFAGE